MSTDNMIEYTVKFKVKYDLLPEDFEFEDLWQILVTCALLSFQETSLVLSISCHSFDSIKDVFLFVEIKSENSKKYLQQKNCRAIITAADELFRFINLKGLPKKSVSYTIEQKKPHK